MLYYRKQAKNSRQRLQGTDQSIVPALHGLLGSCVALLFVLLSSSVPVVAAVWLHIGFLYLTFGYNFQSALHEYRMSKFNTYRITSSASWRAFLYLLWEHNPLLGVGLLYMVLATVGNAVVLPRFLALVYAILLVIHYLFLQSGLGGLASFIGYVVLLANGASFLYSKLLWLSGAATCLFVLATAYQLWTSTCLSNSYPHSMKFGKKMVIEPSFHILPFYMFRLTYQKQLVWIIVSLLGGLLSHALWGVQNSSLFLFLSLLDLELLLDKKHKHLYAFINKYEFIKQSSMNFWQRFMISDACTYTYQNVLYMLVFLVVSQASFLAIGLQVLTVLGLGCLYYQLEERMYETSKKTNSILFQYVLFLALALLSGLLVMI